jgi:transposase
MAKVSLEDKMRIQTLHEQGMGAKAIRSTYPNKKWSLTTVKRLCQKVDETGSAVERKRGSGRPKSARTRENVARIEELICSQEDQPGTSKSVRQISREVGISRRSVTRIAKLDLRLSVFKRTPVQVINEATRLKRMERSRALLQRLPFNKIKHVFFTDEKIFYLNPPVNSQNNRVWSAGRKRRIDPQRLLVQRAKFSPHVMVSAGISFSAKEAFILWTIMRKLMQPITSTISCQILLPTAKT